MSFPQDSKAYSQGIGTARINANTVIQQRAPAASDWNYQIGTVWLDQTNIAEYTLLSLSSAQGVVSASWLPSGGGTTGVSTINTLIPSAGNITIAGTASQVSIANAGSTVTISTPSAFIAPGSIAATTSITATLGNITATNGNFFSSTAGKAFNLNSAATSGTTTATLNGRVGQITITTPSIAAGATFAMTITNSSISDSSTQVGYWLTGGTTGSALSIQSYANTAGQSVVTIQNGNGATTNTASLILNFLVIN